MRFPSWGFTAEGATTTQISNVKRLMQIADTYGLMVNLDLHTWYTTDLSTTTRQQEYLSYMRNTIPQFENEPNLQTWMVLNEPPAETASTSFNLFIRDLVVEAKTLTTRPVSVRFMMGYSPDTGHYAAYIDEVVDFICRNSYWDARNPSRTVYGVSEAKLLNAIDNAHGLGKEIWVTEFGKTSDQAGYYRATIDYFKSAGVDRCYAWAVQIEGSENYNIFDGLTPLSAFYELQ
jgi:hypothetical protein